MQRRKNKYRFLFVGILIGFFVGWLGSIMWEQRNRIKECSFSKKINSFFSVLTDNNSNAKKSIIKLDSITTQPSVNNKNKLVTQYFKTDKINTIDTVKLDEYSQSALDEFVAKYSGSADSLVIDSFIKKQCKSINSAEDIVVLKDQLLFSKPIEATGNKLSVKDKNLDSLLTDEQCTWAIAKSIFIVEFWKSPINYRGYKKIKTKIILFGIYQFDVVFLKYVDKSLYLCYADKYYMIENTAEFKPLIPVNDDMMLIQLKKL